MKASKSYHNRTPDLVEQLSKDIAAAIRMGMTTITVTSVPSIGTNTARLTSYHFDAEAPDWAALEEQDRAEQAQAELDWQDAQRGAA